MRESAPIGTVIATLETGDEDRGQTHTYVVMATVNDTGEKACIHMDCGARRLKPQIGTGENGTLPKPW